jgi:predicted NACHT family NTPase
MVCLYLTINSPSLLNGKFQSDLIAIFIEFRQIRDSQWQSLDKLVTEPQYKKNENGQWLEVIENNGQWLENIIIEKIDFFNQEQLILLLKAGKLLVLMDGFDEVSTEESRKNVQKQLEEFSERYPKNRFILTCRTQIIKSVSDGFTSVEVAEFNEYQVEAFIRNWFQANGQDKETVNAQWEAFSEFASRNAAFKELSSTPVLLGLMCLVLQDDGEIPAEAGLLYNRGIKLLLEKWNESKDIPQWEIGTSTYRKLNIAQKENLLMQIAAKKFENSQNFVLFKEDDLVEQIYKKLNLSNRLDAAMTLKAIESQHGLLVERADELWSFSHLTFQEYFTTKWLLSLSSETLSQKIGDLRWQETMQQLIKSQGQSDRLLRLIKKAIDYSLSSNNKLQDFLVWVLEKSQSIKALHRLTETRSFYFSYQLDRGRNLDDARDFEHNSAFDFDITLVHDLALVKDLDLIFDLDANLDITLDIQIDLDLELGRVLGLNLETGLDRALSRITDRYGDVNPELTDKLKQLGVRLPKQTKNNSESKQWWEEHSQNWMKELQKIIVEYRNIGHTWHFTYGQNKQLESYYDTNKFLVKLLKIENSVSPEVRQEIEDNLLLPIAELKRRLPDQYGS